MQTRRTDTHFTIPGLLLRADAVVLQSAPQERPPECLCFLNAEDPNQVALQILTVEGDNITMGMLEISYHDTPAYNPPAGADMTEWVKRHWLEMHANIPDEPNMG